MKLLQKKLIIIGAFSIMFGLPYEQAFSQADVVNVIKAGAADAGKLADAYISPLAKGFGAGLNGGWYNTAKTHGLGRFDVTLNLNAVLIPDEDKTYDATQLGFSKLQIKPGTGPLGQTYAGDLKPGATNPIYQLYGDNPATATVDPNEVLVAEFDAPPGTSLPYSGAPTVQIAVGLIKNTEVMFRYMPSLAFGDVGDIKLFGIGVKHDIKQWIPGIKHLPFDFAGYFGYTKFNSTLGLALDPESGVPIQAGNTSNFKNQELSMETSATTFGAILSKKVLMVTVYGAASYQTSLSKIALTGDYPLTVIEDRPGANFGTNVVSTIKDPVNIEVEGADGMSATLGARLKLLILTIQGSYTFSKYPMATLGIGINIDLK